MSEREPTRDEYLAMAYADGELAPAARAEFEQRLAHEPALRREVSALRELELLARHAAPKEPADHEWEALAREPVQQAALGLGGGLLTLGALTVLMYGMYELMRSELAPLLKWSLVALVLGAAFLFGAVLRARLRTLPLDPYRKVQR